MSADLFNEDTLRAALVANWGEHGAHVDVFDTMLRHVEAITARAEKAERERDTLRSILAELADEAVIVPRFASVREVHTLMARSLDGDRLPVLDLTAAQVEALGECLT